LSATFRCEEVVVSAAQALWINAADAGPRIINRALTGFGIEKLAHRLEDMVLLMAKDAIAVRDLCEAFLGLLIAEVEMSGQPLNISPPDCDPIVAAAICRTLRTIEKHT